jgi:hypothetical protein
MQPQAPASSNLLEYAPSPDKGRWRLALLLAVVEGFAAGALVLAFPRLALILVPLFTLGLALHLCQLARRRRVILGLLFSAALAASMATGAVWVAVHVPRRHDEQMWAALYWCRAFAATFCMAGLLSLFVSIPMTVAARRRQSTAA